MNVPILIHKSIGKGSSSNLGIEVVGNTEASCLCARDYKGISRMRANAVIVGGVEEITEYLKIKEATIKGYAEAGAGDGVNLGVPNSKTRRGRVENGGVNTLTCANEMGVVIEETVPKPKLRIRKLTPKECWRLQGWGFKREDGTWDDTAFEKAKAAGVSDSQLYRQAGNGCSANVVMAIGLRLKEIENEREKEE